MANPGRIDCRACHNIHASYTSDDWALKTVEPVKLVALDATYDGGMGNVRQLPPAAHCIPRGDGWQS